MNQPTQEKINEDSRQHQFLHSVVHIALTSYPIKGKDTYVNRVNSMFKSYVKENTSYPGTSDEDIRNYFSPLAFHIFGHYDIAFITLINSYKFAQRVFDIPTNGDDESGSQFKSNSYQILAGSILKFNDKLSRLESHFDRSSEEDNIGKNYPFLSITNLKLNNGVLIGNGYKFKELVIHRIDAIMEEYDSSEEKACKFILINSFSWNELTLLLFAKEPKILAEIVLRIRQIQIKDLDTQGSSNLASLIKNSLYSREFTEDRIKESHALVDTHSYMGVDYDLYNKGDAKIINEDFSTVIEWQTRPGHIKSLIKELNANDDITSSTAFKSGKTDYVTLETNPQTIASNHKVYNKYRDPTKNIHEHVRKLKTTPSFPVDLDKPWFKEPGNPASIFEILIESQIEDIEKIVEKLKVIKISRQLRKKVEKVFLNFNCGITDSISCIYFIDFYNFLLYFRTHIEKLELFLLDVLNNGNISGEIHNNKAKVEEIEKNIDLLVNAFEEAYQIRILNNYNYEDLNEFNVDFNSSITQILSTYDVIIKMLSPSLFDDERKILVGQNEVNTKSNHFSINYNVYHLLEPPLVFNTIVKEILNSLHDNLEQFVVHPDDELGVEEKERKDKIIKNREVVLEAGENIYSEFINLKSQDDKPQKRLKAIAKILLQDFDFLYFEIDYIKYAYTFNFNTDLYFFWSWVYFLQNTSVYNSLGHIDENHFIKELSRILYTISITDPDYLDSGKMEAPIPELYYYWERHFHRLKTTIKEITELESFVTLVNALSNLIKEHNFLNVKRSHYGPASDYIDTLIKTKEENPEDLNEEQLAFINSVNSSFPYQDESRRLPRSNTVNHRFQILEAFYLRHCDNFTSGKILVFVEEPEGRVSPELFFSGIAYTTLRWYYNKSKGKINLLRRDYSSGTPQKAFVNLKKDVPFFVDPHGDFFIINNEFRVKSLRFKHAVLESLSHLGQVMKKGYFR